MAVVPGMSGGLGSGGLRQSECSCGRLPGSSPVGSWVRDGGERVRGSYRPVALSYRRVKHADFKPENNEEP